MKNWGIRIAVTGISLCLAPLIFYGCKTSGGAGNGSSNSVTSKTISIGEYGSITGQQASFGTSTDNAIQLAAKQLNAAGGIDGKKVEIHLLDDQGQQDKATLDVKQLIDQYHVVAVLGEVASSNSLAGGRVCQENKIPMISPSSTNPAVTQIGDYIFRVCFIDPFQAAVMARFAHDQLHATRVALFTNKDQAYSTGFSDNFKKAFIKMGGQIVAEKSYGQSDTDYRGALTAIKQANPQAILIPGYYTDVGSIARQARALGITCPLLGGDGWDSSELFKTGGSAIEGCYFSDHLAIDDPSPRVQKFVSSYMAAYHQKPDSLAALAYDSANLLFSAMKSAKSLTPSAIRDAIATTKNFPGVSGNITINAQRNADKSAVIIQVENGQFKKVAEISDPSLPMSQQPH